MTPKRSSTHARAYVVCLDCGKEFAYNWNEMRMEEEPTAVPAIPSNVRITRPARESTRILRLGS